MKTRIPFVVSVVLALFVFAGTTLAETYSQNQTRSRNQNQIQNRRVKQNLKCQLVDAAADTQVPFDGTVQGVCPFEGLKIDTAAGGIVVYGLGPVSYWTANNMHRPEVGDQVSVVVRKITFTDEPKYLLMSLEYTDTDTGNPVTIILRDGETGCPLWRQ